MTTNQRETIGAVSVWLLIVAIWTALAIIVRGADLPRPSDAIDETRSPNAVALGRKLFFDPIISANGKVSCSTCHDPAKGWTDGKRVSDGVNGQTTRNAPTIIRAGLHREQFYDGRAVFLEGQTLAVLVNNLEVGHTTTGPVLRRLRAHAEYPALFARAFPGVSQPITEATLPAAVAAFQRSLSSSGAPLERFLSGDTRALTARQRRGFEAFRSAGCVSCHDPRQNMQTLADNPDTRGDERAANVGTAIRYPLPDGSIDQGRFAQTNAASDRRAFKIPSLYDVARTAPYGVFGRSATIRDRVLDYRADRLPANDAALDSRLRRDWRPSDAEVADIVAFLETAPLSREYPR